MTTIQNLCPRCGAYWECECRREHRPLAGSTYAAEVQYIPDVPWERRQMHVIDWNAPPTILHVRGSSITAADLGAPMEVILGEKCSTPVPYDGRSVPCSCGEMQFVRSEPPLRGQNSEVRK